MVLSQRQLFAAIVLSAVAVVLAAVGSVLYTETATVKLSVPPQRIGVSVTLSGGQAGANLQTQPIHAAVTDSQQGSASSVQIAPTYASGRVVFHCSPACKSSPLNIPQGTLISTAKSLGYSTQAAATVTSTTDSAPIAVRATAPGKAWNADAGALTTIANSPDGNLHVTNSAAIAGGADARTAQVIQQSDFDAVRNALTAKINDELAAALKVNAQGLSYIADALPVINITSDHHVGEETTTFTISMTGTTGAIAFSDSQAQALLRSALQARMSPHEQLTSDPIQTAYGLGPTNAAGDVIVIGKATGYVIPALSPASLRSQIRALTPAQAARSLQNTAPGSLVEIRISPSAVPWLPVVADHISVTVIVEPAAPIAGG
jgi:hypothetical protein